MLNLDSIVETTVKEDRLVGNVVNGLLSGQYYKNYFFLHFAALKKLYINCSKKLWYPFGRILCGIINVLPLLYCTVLY